MPPSQLRGQINLRNLSVSFSSRGKDLLALQDVNVSISPGEFICLLGPSGCGKSTLLNCIAGFVSPTLGSVEVDGDLITSPGPDRGMVFQNHSLYPWKTVLKNISFGPEITLRGRVHLRQRHVHFCKWLVSQSMRTIIHMNCLEVCNNVLALLGP